MERTPKRAARTSDGETYGSLGRRMLGSTYENGSSKHRAILTQLAHRNFCSIPIAWNIKSPYGPSQEPRHIHFRLLGVPARYREEAINDQR